MRSCPACGSSVPEAASVCTVCGAELGPLTEDDNGGSFRSGGSNKQERLVTVRSFSGPRAYMEADMAKSFLEAEGITSILPGRGSASVLPGVDTLNLLVREQDVERAAEILKSLLDAPLEDANL
jgi:Putative prokaryotic signal transducing protein